MAKPPPMAAWRWRWVRGRAPSAWRAGAIRCPSSCPVIACWRAAAAEGLGFTNVSSAASDSAALAELVGQRLDPKAGPLVHDSGVDVAGEVAPPGFEVRRFALYEAREAAALPDSARAGLQARAL